MDITVAQATNLDAIVSLLKACGNNLVELGIDQWHPKFDYPSRRDVAQDIAEQTLFVAKTGTDILGAVTLNQEQAPEYTQITWRCRREPVLVLHRLAVDPRWQRQGVARQLMEFATEYAIRNGFYSIRLDAYSHNPRSLQLYEKCGYQNVGTIWFPGRQYHFYCFEKLIGSTASLESVAE